MPSPAPARRRRLASGAAVVALTAGSLGTGQVSGPVGAPTPAAASSPAYGDGAVQLRGRAPAVTLTVPTTVAARAGFRVSGTAVVRPQPTSIRPRPVRIVERVRGRWRVLATTRSTRSGTYAVRIAAGRQARTRTLRAEVTAFRGLSAARTGAVRVVVRLRPSPVPKRGDVIRPERLPTGYVAAGSASDWSYLFDYPGARGGRWNPCQDIRWSYNPAGQRYRALADVSRAFAKISGVSGLRFRYVGTTPYRYLGTRSERSFPATTDMVVSWASPGEMPALGGAVVGLGGASGYAIDTPGADVDVKIVRGHLTLDKGAGVPLPPGFRGSSWGQVMMHEILHTLGLGHAKRSSQLMYPTATSRNVRFGAGDLRGMRKIGVAPGSSGCL